MPYLADMCPADLRKARNDGLILMIATGSVEFHGGQLPFGTDLFIAEGIASELEKRVPIVIAPSFIYSPTGHAVSGPEDGTVDISVDCFIDYCGQILENYARMGFKKIYILTHHQSNNIHTFLQTAILKNTIYNANQELGNGWWTKRLEKSPSVSIEAVNAMLDTGFFSGHGGKGETEAVIVFKPETVKMKNIEDDMVWWNNSSISADIKNAKNQKKILIDKWVEKIEHYYSTLLI